MRTKFTNNFAKDLKFSLGTLLVTLGPVLAMAKASEVAEDRKNAQYMRQDAPKPEYRTQRPTFFYAAPSKFEKGSEAPNMTVGKK